MIHWVLKIDQVFNWWRHRNDMGLIGNRRSLLEMYSLFGNDLAWENITFRDSTTSLPAKWCLKNDRKISTLITGHHPDLASVSDYWKVCFIEWFSFECRKTKTKVITLANHIGHRQYIEPIKTRSNYMWLTQSAGKSCERVTIGFGFTSDWMKRWRESFKPIASCRKCKTNYFSTLKWKPLYNKKLF